MAAAIRQGGTAAFNPTPDLNPEPMRQIVAVLSGETRRPKVK